MTDIRPRKEETDARPRATRVGDRAEVTADCTAANLLTAARVTLTENSSAIFAALADVLTPAPEGARILSSQWESAQAIGTGKIGARTVITRVHRAADTQVARTVEITDTAGQAVAHGEQLWSWPVDADSSPHTDFCTSQWGALLRDSLNEDLEFTAPLSTWDGSIGLRCNDIGSSTREIHLRIYRGSVIDVAPRTPAGATFTFVASAQQWCDIALGPTNDFMRRAISGDFSSAGNGYEYVRLTRPLSVIMSHVKSLAGQRNERPAS